MLFTAATAGLPPLAALGQSPGGSGESPAEVARQEFNQLRQTLNETSRSIRERVEAAKRLLERGANDVLLEALRSGSAELQTPVARALAETNNPPMIFLNNLLLCLQPQVTVDLADAASLAIAGYRDNAAARARLREFITSGNIPPARRVPAVRALGTLNDKDTARFLIDLLLGGVVPEEISNAAADALADMTGLTEYGRDVGQWERWWQGQQAKTPEQFLSERRAEREGSARQAVERLKTLSASVDRFVEAAHRRITDPKMREDDVLSTLKDPSPEFRAAGARLVYQDLNAGLPIAEAVKERLRDLIGDSSPDVRRRVAGAIAAVNDEKAANALLAQLQRERIEAVKAELIKALAPTKNLAAVPELVRLLDDPAFQVSEQAAAALRDLGPEIAKSPQLSRTVSNALVRTIDRTTKLRGADRLREFATEAMIPLHETELVQVLFTLMVDQAGNTLNTRNAAIRALAAMNAPPKLQADIAGRVADKLRPDREREKGVRLEAAKALGIIGGPAQGDVLSNAVTATDEDPTVREAAWNSLSSLFEQFDRDTLLRWKDQRFQDAPDKRLTIDLALNKKLIAQGPSEAETLATIQQEIGALYLDPKIDKPDEAVPYLLGALNYWSGKPGGVVNTVQDLCIRAYLRSKQYKSAAQFATAQIQKNAQNTDTMCRAILQEVNRLNRANQLQPALELLAEAKTLPIKGFYQDQFQDLDKDIKSRIVPFYRMNERWVGIYA
jgi:HEAT repeat protein